MIYVVLLIYALLSSLGMVFIKSGGAKTEILADAVSISFHTSWQAIIGLLMYVCSFIMWIFILQKFRLTYISPVAYGIVFVFISIFSLLLLHEPISPKDVVGFIVILAGVVICSI